MGKGVTRVTKEVSRDLILIQRGKEEQRAMKRKMILRSLRVPSLRLS